MHNIFFPPKDWTPQKNNPFTQYGTYDVSWSMFTLNCNLQGRYGIGKQGKGIFTLSVNPNYDDWKFRLGDFIQYETYYHRKIIVHIPEIQSPNFIIEKATQNNFKGKKVRCTDDKWLVHSTSLDSWRLIEESGQIKSTRKLNEDGIEIVGIGIDPLGEPDDYNDYVMLDTLNGCSELVVSSRQKGKICTNGDVEYNPQVRMYFNARKIIEDGLGVRDGAHVLKIYRSLPLKPYLKKIYFEKDIPYIKGRKSWTPTLFTEEANKWFYNSLK
ncbi:hypothetical protein [Clostridium sp.]|jgi:hypothetical protein|uniref:hypothetical protein n=1 Tax=Clostridium sp. TaxID=1506 RepID=UPI002583E11A|nr:hypothetical protein [Clostridium sp.]MDF2504911.1 hypothetical protein [Clostridium sp.]